LKFLKRPPVEDSSAKGVYFDEAETVEEEVPGILK